MKTNHLFAILLASATLAGCSKELVAEQEIGNDEGMISINVSGSIDQVQTKVSAGGFMDGDAVGLYAVNYSENNTVAGTLAVEGNQADNVKYVFNGTKWVPVKSVYYKNVNTNVDIYLYYPYQGGISDVSSANFEVKKDQSTAKTSTALSGYEASDFLWGKGENITPVESAIQIPMYHKLSAVSVTLVEKAGFEDGEFENLEKNVILMSTSRKATINYATGEATKVGDPQLDGIVMCPQTNGSFRAIVIPQSIESATRLFSITIDGVTYGFKQDDVTEYQPGKQMNFNINITKKTPSGEYELTLGSTQITDWVEDVANYVGTARLFYVVNLNSAGSLQSVIETAKKDPTKIKNLKIVGPLNSDDFTYMRENMTILTALNLKEAMLEDNKIPDNAMARKTSLMYVTFPDNLVEIGKEAFYRSNISGALILPDNVSRIDDSAFQDCEQITSLSLNSNLSYLGSAVFSNCSRMAGGITFPNGLRHIGESCFAYDYALTGRLILPDGLEYLGGRAFGSTSFTGNLEIPESLTVIDNYAFYCVGFGGTLSLHDGIKSIGEGAFYGCGFKGTLSVPSPISEIPSEAFAANQFTSIDFNDGLISIGNNSFYRNTKLEELIFPEGLEKIGECAFMDCGALKSIIIPSSISFIFNSAFMCSGGFGPESSLTSIICEAVDPPYIESTTFQGVEKRNVLKVPEQSIGLYSTDSYWGQFVSIKPNYGFYLRNADIAPTHDAFDKTETFKVLTDGLTKDFVLNCPANQNWYAVTDSIPSWVTIDPLAGTGKTKIIVTVNEMSAGSGNRSAIIPFKMTEKDCESDLIVEQYDYKYNDGDVVKLFSASKGNGVDIVLMGDGYDASDISSGKYLNDLTEGAGYFFDIEPYKTYKDYFNVSAVFALSDDSGISDLYAIKDNAFGSLIHKRIELGDIEKCFSYANKASIENISQSLIVLIPNSTIYDGVAYLYADGSAIAVCPKSAQSYPYDFRGVIQHEAGGHGFGKLGDEYIYHNAFYKYCDCTCCDHLNSLDALHEIGFYRNLSLTFDDSTLPWAHLIYNPQFSDYVDVFEGGYMHSRGVYRSEKTSCMNNNIQYYSAISRQAIVERIMEYSGETFTLQKFYDNDVDDFDTMTKSTFGAQDRTGGVNPNWNMGNEHGSVIYMGEHPDYSKIKK